METNSIYNFESYHKCQVDREATRQEMTNFYWVSLEK